MDWNEIMQANGVVVDSDDDATAPLAALAVALDGGWDARLALEILGAMGTPTALLN